MRKLFLNFLISSLATAYGVALTQPVSAHSEHTEPAETSKVNTQKDGVHEEVVIKASPKVVWQSMQEQRKLDPDSQGCRQIGHCGQSLVEQKFKFPSPFGDAECVLLLSETPSERVDFKLIESEELKHMEGSWILTPMNNGLSTKLGLSSYVEPHMLIPRILTNAIISHKAKRNLVMVKRIAEKSI